MELRAGARTDHEHCHLACVWASCLHTDGERESVMVTLITVSYTKTFGLVGVRVRERVCLYALNIKLIVWLVALTSGQN